MLHQVLPAGLPLSDQMHGPIPEVSGGQQGRRGWGCGIRSAASQATLASMRHRGCQEVPPPCADHSGLRPPLLAESGALPLRNQPCSNVIEPHSVVTPPPTPRGLHGTVHGSGPPGIVLPRAAQPGRESALVVHFGWLAGGDELARSRPPPVKTAGTFSPGRSGPWLFLMSLRAAV